MSGSDLDIWSGPAGVEDVADPAQYVVQACEQAKHWLVLALEDGDIDRIVELKSQTEAIRVYTAQKQLGKHAETSAQEIIRRAERGIGIAIRQGQQAGQIKTRADGGWSARNLDGTGGRNKRSVEEFLPAGTPRADTYAMTDGVSDEQFEQALGEAKNEQNLTRANVVRKVRKIKQKPVGTTDPKVWIPQPTDRSAAAAARRRELIRDYAAQGYSSRQISARIGTLTQTVRDIAREIGVEIHADIVTRRARRHDSNRIVRETVHALEGLALGVQLVDPDELDARELAAWTGSLTTSTRALNRLIKQMKELTR